MQNLSVEGKKHLADKLNLKLAMDNGFGGKGYEVPKKMIRPPRAPKKLSDSAKKKLVEKLRRDRVLSAENLVPVGKLATKNQNKGEGVSGAKKRQNIATLS